MHVNVACCDTSRISKISWKSYVGVGENAGKLCAWAFGKMLILELFVFLIS